MQKFLLGFVAGILVIPAGGVCGGVARMVADRRESEAQQARERFYASGA